MDRINMAYLTGRPQVKRVGQNKGGITVTSGIFQTMDGGRIDFMAYGPIAESLRKMDQSAVVVVSGRLIQRDSMLTINIQTLALPCHGEPTTNSTTPPSGE